MFFLFNQFFLMGFFWVGADYADNQINQNAFKINSKVIFLLIIIAYNNLCRFVIVMFI